MSVDLSSPGFRSLDLQSRRTNSSTDSHRGSMFNRLRSQFASHKEQHPSASLQNRNIERQNPEQPQSYTASVTKRPAPGTKKPFAVPGDAPPAYSAAPSVVPSAERSDGGSPRARGEEDPYSFLSTFDTVFLIDDSSSMAGGRWRETADALEAITPVVTAHDTDGIDIIFLKHPGSNNQSKGTGVLPTDQRLNQVPTPYLEHYTANPDVTEPLTIICITEGHPNDELYAAKKLAKIDTPEWQLGVQFFLVGNDGPATLRLKRQMGDELAHIAGQIAVRDVKGITGSAGLHTRTATVVGVHAWQLLACLVALIRKVTSAVDSCISRGLYTTMSAQSRFRLALTCLIMLRPDYAAAQLTDERAIDEVRTALAAGWEWVLLLLPGILIVCAIVLMIRVAKREIEKLDEPVYARNMSFLAAAAFWFVQQYHRDNVDDAATTLPIIVCTWILCASTYMATVARLLGNVSGYLTINVLTAGILYAIIYASARAQRQAGDNKSQDLMSALDSMPLLSSGLAWATYTAWTLKQRLEQNSVASTLPQWEPHGTTSGLTDAPWAQNVAMRTRRALVRQQSNESPRQGRRLSA